MFFFSNDHKKYLISQNNEPDIQNPDLGNLIPNFNISNSLDFKEHNQTDSLGNNLLSINSSFLYTSKLDNIFQNNHNDNQIENKSSQFNPTNNDRELLYTNFPSLNINNDNNNKDIYFANNIPSKMVTSKNPKSKKDSKSLKKQKNYIKKRC